MAKHEKRTTSASAGAGPSPRGETRQERLEAALRENLKRRKRQTKLRAESSAERENLPARDGANLRSGKDGT